MTKAPEPPEVWMRDVVSVLDRTIGFDAASIGAEALHHSIRAAYEASGFADPTAFVAAVQHDERHRHGPDRTSGRAETCFLRDRGPFEFLARHATQWLRTHVRRAARAERPVRHRRGSHSIAIALLEAGVPGDRFVVDAVDVSERCRARATRSTRIGVEAVPAGQLSDARRSRRWRPTTSAATRFERRNLLGGARPVTAL
jgi:chemotaxis protein methyltransferase WspC